MDLKSLLQSLGLLAVLFTLAPFIAADYWWIRIFDFPHTQLTILTLVAFVTYFVKFDIKAVEDYLFVFVLGACLTFQAAKIFPYLPHGNYEIENATEDIKSSSIKFYISNVLQKNESFDKLINEISKEDADVLLLMETDKIWMDNIRPGVETYPYRVEVPLDNTYGMLLYSKLPLIDPEVKYLIDDSIPSIHSIIQLHSGEKVKFISIHPTPPMPQHNPTSTDRDAEIMIVAKEVRNSKIPVIVAGDFNDVAWSQSTELFKNVSGLLDPRVGRGFFNTFNAKSPIMRWPLDHFFASDHFRLKSIKLGKDIDSDHFPAVFEVSLEPQGAQEQEQEKASQDELEEADKAIDKAREEHKEKDKEAE